ncbi:MAG: polyphosphate kinase 2, partial [Paracoccus sp. (in: a-proteobacteria)]|nr:polyphosphate kinase 2 [Paracoccus sp. (in: a-proteobacteria)]
MTKSPIPHVGEITDYLKKAPKEVRRAIEEGSKKDILEPSYPYDKRMDSSAYNEHLEALQEQLVRMMYEVIASGKRVVVIFEGRDAAGKGGSIERVRMNLNPRSAYIVAL